MNAPRPIQREGEPSEHYKVGVKPDTFDASYSQERETVLVFQTSELALTAERRRR